MATMLAVTEDVSPTSNLRRRRRLAPDGARRGPAPYGAGRGLPSYPSPQLRARATAREGERGSGPPQEEAKQRLLVAMLPLVKQVAWEMRGHLPAHIEMDDLVGAGVQGLVDAVAKFDPSRQVKLRSYARHRIRGSILDGLRTLDPASRDMRKKYRRVEKVYRELVARLRRPVDDEEMSAALGVTLEEWHRILAELHSVSLDGWPRRTTGGGTRVKLAGEEAQIASSQEGPWELCYRREQHEVLERALARLPEREQMVMTLYYRHELSMQQIAARLGVGESRISQLHAAALHRLKARVQAMLRPSEPLLPPRTESFVTNV